MISERVRLGGLDVSRVGIGGNTLGTDFFGSSCDQDTVTTLVNTALDVGINLFDTAEEYSITSFLGEGRSEQMIGVALRGRRDEAIVASKFGGTSEIDPHLPAAERIVASVENSLRRLGTDRIDLYQQHQPDPNTPIDEILDALQRLIAAGKVREIGTCNVSGPMLDDAAAAARRLGVAGYRSCQVQYSLLERPAPEVVDAARRHDVGLLAYFPLASGLLTGKYRRGATPPAGSRLGGEGTVSTILRSGRLGRRAPLSDERLATVERLDAFARERGHSLLELAMSWVAGRPEVTAVITGVTKPEQVRANAAAIGWALTAADREAVDAIVAAEE